MALRKRKAFEKDKVQESGRPLALCRCRCVLCRYLITTNERALFRAELSLQRLRSSWRSFNTYSTTNRVIRSMIIFPRILATTIISSVAYQVRNLISFEQRSIFKSSLHFCHAICKAQTVFLLHDCISSSGPCR